MGTLGQGANGIWDKGTWRQQSPPQPLSLGPCSAVWVLPRGIWGSCGTFWGAQAATRLPWAVPHSPAAPLTPAWALLALWAAGLCLALNPPNYSGWGGGENKKQGGGKGWRCASSHAWNGVKAKFGKSSACRRRVGQSCSHGQKIQPWWVSLGFGWKEKGLREGREGKELAKAGGKARRRSLMQTELGLSHQEKDRLHRPCLSHQTLPGHHLQARSN